MWQLPFNVIFHKVSHSELFVEEKLIRYIDTPVHVGHPQGIHRYDPV